MPAPIEALRAAVEEAPRAAAPAAARPATALPAAAAIIGAGIIYLFYHTLIVRLQTLPWLA